MSERSRVICSALGCESPSEVRGWCGKHYSRWRRHGNPETVLVRRNSEATCSVEHCDLPAKIRGFCDLHYGRVLRHGDPLVNLRQRDVHGSPGKYTKGCRCDQCREGNTVRMRNYLRHIRQVIPEVVRERTLRGNNARRARKRGVASEPYTRREVWKKTHGRCWYCKGTLDPAAWHIDHVEPLGPGLDTFENVVPACPRCNLRKKRKSAAEFRRILGRPS
jgi:5-methylcytosine-specific restriction endonuclease McrA